MKLKLLVLIQCIFAFFIVAQSRDYHDVIWNSRFFSHHFKHTHINVRINDQLTIICPKAYHQGMNYEFAKLYWVSKQEWTQCYLENPVWVGVCANANDTTTIKATFRKMSPVPGGMDFQVGKTFYLMSTSSGSKDQMDQQSGGLCWEHQMKLAVKVVGSELPSMQYEIHDSQSLISSESTSPASTILSVALQGVLLIIMSF